MPRGGLPLHKIREEVKESHRISMPTSVLGTHSEPRHLDAFELYGIQNLERERIPGVAE